MSETVITGPFGVYSGQTSVGLQVDSGGILHVVAGGTIMDTTVSSGGEVWESYGGGPNLFAYAYFTVLGSNAVETVWGGGISDQTTISGAGAGQNINSAGEAIGATVEDGGIQWLGQGTATDTTVSSGGLQDLGGPGVASGTTVDNGGTLYAPGGSAWLAQISSGGVAAVVSGGSASGTAVSSGGILAVGSGGTTHYTTIGNGGTEAVFSGGVETDAFVQSGGQLVLLGGSVTAMSVSAGGTLVVESLTAGVFTATDVTVSGLYVQSGVVFDVENGGTAFNTYVMPGGTEWVSSGGIASGTAVNSGGQLWVANGGSAEVGAVWSGGTMDVLDGGSASHFNFVSGMLKVESGGTLSIALVGSGGEILVGSGGTASGVYVDVHGYLLVSGGIASDTGLYVRGNGNTGAPAGETEAVVAGGTEVVGGTLDCFDYLSGPIFNFSAGSGGTVDVVSGGEIDYAIIGSGGTAEVFQDGYLYEAFVSSGGSDFVSGSAYSTVLRQGEESVVAGGSATATHVSSGGTETVHSGGVTSVDTITTGGVEIVSAGGSATWTQIWAGGSETIDNGGFDSASMVSGGGTEIVASGGVAYDTEVASGGTMIVSNGGTEFATVSVASVSLAGGTESVYTQGGSAWFDTVSSGGQLYISWGGTAVRAIVSSGGVDIVSSGGFSVATMLSSGGEEHVSAYGTASGTQVLSGGTEFVFADGTASTMMVSNGGSAVVAGGTTSRTRISNGGVEAVNAGGSAVSTTVINGGQQVVNAGGTASATAVLSGGTETVLAGGESDQLTVSNGGSESVAAGGVVNGASIVAGGWLAGAGLLSGAIVNNGNIQVEGGTLDITQGLAGAGTLEVLPGSVVILGGNATVFDLQVDNSGMAELTGVTVTTDPTTIEPGGTITGDGVIGGDISDYGVIIDDGGLLQLTGDITGAGTLVIEAGGTLLLDGAVASGTTIDFAPGGTGTLELADAGAMQGTILGEQGGDEVVDVSPCFAAGTRIATPGGEVAVETLRIGDSVRLAGGGTAPVVWLGYRHLDCRRHPRPWDVLPVRIAADAFAPGRPRRDLRLSPDHAVLVDGVLIPVRYLINGATVRQEEVACVTYWHVELPAHGLLLAEGLAAESYLDTGNRSAFANGGGVAMLQPDFALRVWEAAGCARLVRDGAELVAARSFLLERAQVLGHVLTRDPALRLSAGERLLRPTVVGQVHRFRLPAGVRSVRLVSLSAAPAHVRDDSDDTRRLGVAVARIVLDGKPIALTDGRLTGGWRDIERAASKAWRWTNGNAGLLLRGGRVLEVEVVLTERYWTGPAVQGSRLSPCAASASR